MINPYRSLGLTLLAVLLTHLTIYAQQSIQGQLLDEADVPLSYASIMLLNTTDSTLIKGDLSTEEGSFELTNIAPDTYLLAVSMVGYDDYFSNHFTVDDGDLNLGTIRMSSGGLDLTEVEVVARKPLYEQRIDRLVVNVAQSITSTGNTALEVLERSPGVMVDRLGDGISISGRNGVVIMINNKVSQLPVSALIQLLSGMPADNIERIEIITTPPANFDAQGNAGIISIILKKNLDEGLNGNINLTAGYGVHEKYGGSINFNYRKGIVNVFGDYGYNFNHTAQEFTNYRAVTQNGSLLETDNVSDRDPRTATQNARLGVDVQVSDNTVIGILTTYGHRDWNMDAINTIDLLTDQVLTERIVSTNDEINVWESYLANFNLQHTFGNEGRLSFDLDYAAYTNDNPTFYVNELFNTAEELISTNQLRVGKDTPIDIYVAKIDYSQALSEGLNLEVGLKGTSSIFDNDFSVENLVQGIWVSDDDFTAKFSLDEQIGAAYTALSWELSKKTSFKGGLRYEYTDSNLGTATEPDIVDRQYGNWFPSLFLTQNTGDNQELQLSYSRRINRPAYTQLAPFVIFLDPNTLLTGNVALQPDFTDAFRAGYRYKSWFLSLEYSYTDQAIAGFQPQIDPETNQQINSPTNLDSRQAVSANLSFPLQITPWWSSRSNLVGVYSRNEADFDEGTVDITNTSLLANTTHTFKLPADITMEISGYYLSPTVFGFIKSRPLGDINIGFQREVGKNGGTLRVNLSDVFLSGNYVAVGKVPELNIDYRGKYGFAERTLTVAYSRNFGNNKVKEARRRSGGSDAERQRVNY